MAAIRVGPEFQAELPPLQQALPARRPPAATQQAVGRKRKTAPSPELLWSPDGPPLSPRQRKRRRAGPGGLASGFSGSEDEFDGDEDEAADDDEPGRRRGHEDPMAEEHRAVDMQVYEASVLELFRGNAHAVDPASLLHFYKQCDFNTNRAAELLYPAAAHNSELDDEELQLKAEAESEDHCFVCGDGGNLLICDETGCSKVYHQTCAGLEVIPDGAWSCARHHCNYCRLHVSSANGYMCDSCPTSFCFAHVPPELKPSGMVTPVFKCLNCLTKIRRGSKRGKRQFLEMLLETLEQSESGVSPQGLTLRETFQHIQAVGGVDTMIEQSWRDVRKALRLSTHGMATR